MKKFKKTDISIMNVFAGIGIACVLLGSVMLFSYLAIVKDENGQYALTLLGAKIKPPASKVVKPSVSASVAGGESACGFLRELTWNGANPSSIAFDKEGNIYIVDKGTNKIKVFNKNGDKEITFNLNQTLKDPEGIAIHYDKDNNLFVYVADTGNGRLAKFDSTGAFVKEWKNIPGGGEFAPTHMTYYINYNGYPPVSYIAVLNKKSPTSILKLELNDTKDLELFTAQGNLPTHPITSIATSYLDYDLKGPVQFLYASSKANDNSVNEVYKYYLYTGAPATPEKWGKTGPLDGEFDAIGEIAVLGWQRTQLVFASDTIKGVIYEFDGNGNLRSVFRGQTGGGDNYKGVLSVFRMQWKDPATGGLLTNENLYGITKNGVRIFGTDCAKLIIEKDFVPGTDPRDFEFNITVVKPNDPQYIPSNYTSGKFTLNDDKHISTSYNVPKPADPKLIFNYNITETKDPNIKVSWTCKYQDGTFRNYTTPGSDEPNVASINVGQGTTETTCTFTNENGDNAKIIVVKKFGPSKYNPTDFSFTLTAPDVKTENFILDADFGDWNIPVPILDKKEFIVSGDKEYTITEIPTLDKDSKAPFTVSCICLYTNTLDGSPVKNNDGTPKISQGSGNIAKVTVGWSETATCTFLNELDKKAVNNGTIIIKKVTLPSDPTTSFEFNISDQWSDTGLDDSFNLKNGGTKTFTNVDQSREYSIFEKDKYRDYIVSIGCVDSSGKSVRIIDYQHSYIPYIAYFKFTDPLKPDTITCTVTNTKWGEIVVIKNTVPKPDFTDFKFDLKGGEVQQEFLLDDEPRVTTRVFVGYDDFGSEVYETKIFDLLPKEKSFKIPFGKYNLQEFFDSRYETTYICTSSIKGKAPISGKGGNIKEIVLAVGEKLTCTFTNKKCTKGALCGIDTTTLPKGGIGGTP